jgi:hypothetical protein
MSATAIAAAADNMADGRDELVAMLREAGAPDGLAETVARVLGVEAAARLVDDPWSLLDAGPIVTPRAADAFARARLGGAARPDDPRRARALLRHLLARAAADGHTVALATTLCSALCHYGVAATPEDAAAALADALDAGDALAFSDGDEAEDFDGDDSAEASRDEPSADATGDGAAGALLIGLERYAFAEASVAEAVQRLLAVAEPLDLSAVALAGDDPTRRELRDAVAAHGLVLLGTAPGVARTRQLVDFVAALREAGVSVALAGTGFASVAKLLAAIGAADGVPGGVADTLAVSGDGASAGAPLLAALAADPPRVLVVGDAHLLDCETAANLLEAVPDGVRVVLAGDPAEPASPRGAGAVFHDLWQARFGLGSTLGTSGTIPRVSAADRAPDPLTDLRFAVRSGELPEPADMRDPEHRLVLVAARDSGEVVHRAVQLVADSIPSTFGATDADVQVVTVRHGGAAGTVALNAALKQRLNPGPGAVNGFDAGDRIVVTGRAAITPATPLGATGTLRQADEDVLIIVLDAAMPGDTAEEPTDVVTLPASAAAGLRHGWALTVHQALGGSRPAIVAVIDGEATGSLTRALVYAAFGLGERHLSIVQSAGSALPEAVRHVPDRPRRTRLSRLIAEL